MFQVALLPRNLKACEADLRHADHSVRLSVLKDLARGGADEERTRRTSLLVSALRDDHVEVRRQALLALADFGAAEAIDDVLVLLRDPEIRVRQMAIVCLGELCEPDNEAVIGRLASLLQAGDPSLRYQALLAHSQLRPEHAAGDILVGLSDVDAEVRELSLRLVDEVLIAKGIPISTPLKEKVLAACHDPVVYVRLQAELRAAEQLWEAPRDALVEMVAGALRPREPRDLQQAIVLCGRLRLTDARAALERRAFGRLFLSFDPFRFQALAALARLGEERALAKLRQALRARSYAERTMAVQALGEAGNTAALSDLEVLVGRPERVEQEVLEGVLAELSRPRGEDQGA